MELSVRWTRLNIGRRSRRGCSELTRFIVGSLLLIVTLPGAAVAGTLPIVNPNFSTPTIACALGYAYDGSGDCNGVFPGGIPDPQQNFNTSPGFGWTLAAASDGLTGPGTAFDPPSFTGMPFTQAVFLQGTSNDLFQVIPGFSAGGNYVLSFYLGSRQHAGTFDGNQTIMALLNGDVIGTWALTSFTPFTLETIGFTVATSGSQKLEFKGADSGDHTAFLSGVAVSSVPEPASGLLLCTGVIAIAALLRRKVD